MQIIDNSTGKIYDREDSVKEIGTGLNFTEPAKRFLVGLDQMVYLQFENGSALCLTCHYPGRYTVLI